MIDQDDDDSELIPEIFEGAEMSEDGSSVADTLKRDGGATSGTTPE